MKFVIQTPNLHTMEAPDIKIAATVICLLGNGQFTGSGIGTDKAIFIPKMNKAFADQWFRTEFNSDYNTVVTDTLFNRNGDLAKAFESVNLVSIVQKTNEDIDSHSRKIARAIRIKHAELKPK